MFSCTVSQLNRAVAESPADLGACGRITGVSIDSRTTNSGDAFFALAGLNGHGIMYADDAVRCGASCVVTDQMALRGDSRQSGSVRLRASEAAELVCPMVRVSDSIVALQKFAKWNRQQSSGLVVGVTGSVGKTTTRQMVCSVLATQFRGIQSPHNFNNEIGVPLSLLQLNAEHDFAVLEMGAGRIGDIAYVAELAKPEFGIVTRVASAHLESFGSIDAIRRGKQELVEAIPSSGTVFLNADDPAVRSMANATNAEVVLFGFSEEADFRAKDLTAANGVCTFMADGHRFQFHGPRHLATSALAAIVVGKTTGVTNRQMEAAISEFRPDAGRGRVVQRDPWVVIDDTYNASPASVHASIQALSDWTSVGRRILVLGDMLELGSDAERAHFDIGRALISSSIDHALIYGEFADAVVAGARSMGMTMNHISQFRDMTTLQTMLDCLLTPRDVVLVKGSRGMQMERVVRWLSSHDQSDRPRIAA